MLVLATAAAAAAWDVNMRGCFSTKCSPKNLVFAIYDLMTIFAEFTEKECVKKRHPHSTATM